MKNNLKKIIIFAFLILTASFAYSQPVIKAVTSGGLFKLNEIITVEIVVDSNPGIHGLYFDLDFDSSKFEFDSLEEGLMLHRTGADGELLYARSDLTSSIAYGDHIIGAFSLNERGKVTKENGALAELKFRVKSLGLPEDNFRFSFNDCSVRDGSGNDITSAVWIDSDYFLLGSSDNTNFITINQPQENQAFHTDEIMMNLTYTDNALYTVRITNIDKNITNSFSAGGGAASNVAVQLKDGYNRLQAELLDSNGLVVASDIVKVVRAGDERFIKIIAPIDHALVNTDMVDVRVLSPLDNVIINDFQSEDTGEASGDNSIYSTRLWLKKGFNRITASVTDPENGITYKDETVVYYERDNSIFRFETPYQGEIYKPGETSLLNIKGEISSEYSSDNTLNSVTLSVIYYPNNPGLNSRYIVKDQPAAIAEVDYVSSTSQAPYMFYNNFDISLDNLDTGEIEIIAYKNKQGSVWESEIHRLVYLDNNRLYINLVQPHLYGKDVLDNVKIIKGFNIQSDIAADPVMNDVEITDLGEFQLKSSSMTAKNESALENKDIIDMIELKDGSILALGNNLNTNVMTIYKKSFGSSEWETVAARNDMYGYTLCETGMGILVGVSNLFSNDNSGLYLLNNSELKNIRIGEPVPHVQFIKNNNGIIYLYGNDYNYLYSFNIFTLEDDNGSLKSTFVDKDEFYNSLFIEQFELSDDAVTAVVRTKDNMVYFYQNLYGGGFEKTVPEDFKEYQYKSFNILVAGPYNDGIYNSYILYSSQDKTLYSVMEHKETHRLITSNIDLGSAETPPVFPSEERLSAIGFSDNKYYFLHESDSVGYNIRSGYILFNNLKLDADFRTYNYTEGDFVLNPDYSILITDNSPVYIGFNSDININRLFCLSSEYPDTGNISFNYKNPDMEGISGFSFETDPVWIDMDNVKVSFSVRENEGGSDVEGLSVSGEGLGSLLGSPENLFYKIHHTYEAVSGKEIVTVDFNNLQEDKFISFNFDFAKNENITPSVNDFTVYKKVPVKLPRNGDEKIILPIKGFVEDSTVEFVTLCGKDIEVDRYGNFSTFVEILTGEDSKYVEISCENGSGERTSQSFTVLLFDSVNEIRNVQYSTGDDIYTAFTGSALNVTDEYIYLNGDYFGLAGVKTGYQIYGYTYEDGEEVLKLLDSGLFNNIKDETIDPEYYQYGSGYESGSFLNEKIRLYPGKQQIRIYAENPGGLQAEVKIDDNYPVINYNIPLDNQKIIVTNLEAVPFDDDNTLLSGIISEVNGITVDQVIKLEVNEYLDQTDGGDSYVFRRRYLVKGEIKSLYNFNDLKVKSYSPYVKFDSGLSESVISVDSLNRFEVALNIELPEKGEGEDCYIAFIPTAPFMDWMKKSLCIRAEKNFKDTFIVPDFSYMLQENWTSEEKVERSKPLRLGISRYVPDGATISLLLNYETSIKEGRLVEVNPGEGVYKVVDGLTEVELSGVKDGKNRIQWTINYFGLVSSSQTARDGMNDYIFDFQSDAVYEDTVINFPVQIQTYYDDLEDGNKLPNIRISKDKTTTVSILVNDISVYSESVNEGITSIDEDLTLFDPLIQGRNTVSVIITKIDSTQDAMEYNFLYDTSAPRITISTYTYDETYDYLTSLKGVVEEANLKEVRLFYEIDGVYNLINDNLTPPVYRSLGGDLYEVLWDNLGSRTDKLRPSPSNSVQISAEDYSGKISSSSDFDGIGSENIADDNPVPVAFDVSSEKYIDDPFFEDEPGSGVFTNRAKFYNSTIELTNDIDSSIAPYKVERPDTINYGGAITGDTDGSNEIRFRAGSKIILKPGFSVAEGTRFVAEIAEPDTIAASEPLEITHNDAVETLSLGFRFRYEHEPNYLEDNSLRKIFTVFETGLLDGNKTTSYHSLYLVYRDSNCSVPGDEYIYMIEEKYDQPLIYLAGTEDAEGLPLYYSADHSDIKNWNQIIIGIDGTTDTLQLSVNGSQPAVYRYDLPEDADYISDMLAAGANYYFGDKDTNKNGHYSIAQPFYINEMISMEELNDLKTKLEDAFTSTEDSYQHYENQNERFYSFDSASDKVGTGNYYDLEIDIVDKSGETVEDDFFTAYENADYSEDHTHGSLRASDLHINHLTVKNSDILFQDANNAVTANLSINKVLYSDSILLEPVSSQYPGRYYFSDVKGNHSISSGKYYSVYGRIAKYDKNDIKASLVMRVNGREQKKSLAEGDFHFVFENTDESAVISDVILYIETENPIILYKDIVLTEGNYRLPPEGVTGFYRIRAKTGYIFNSEGTVNFMYKPFNINNEGFVNYEAQLFDSDLVNIFTRKNSSDGRTYFSARIHGLENVLYSDIPVTTGWHHLQLSYDVNKGAVYFYVDGQLGSKYESAPPLPFDDVPGSEIFIGSNNTGTDYADGYIDEVKLSHLYLENQFHDKDPVTISYSEDYVYLGSAGASESMLTIDKNTEIPDPDTISYLLKSKRNDYLEQPENQGITDHGFDIPGLLPGQYILDAKIVFNGHRYENKYHFTKNNRPAFILKEWTPLIIKGVKSDLKFRMSFDNSFVQNSNENRYAGIAVKITGNELIDDVETEFSKVMCIVQKFEGSGWEIAGIEKDGNVIDAEDYTVTDNMFNIIFPGIMNVGDIAWEMKSFYFQNIFTINGFDFDSIPDERTGAISEAVITPKIITMKSIDNDREYQYKINVKVGAGNNTTRDELFKQLKLGYRISTADTGTYVQSGDYDIDSSGELELYYDDILPDFGNYKCILSLRFEGQTYDADECMLSWENLEISPVISEEKRLDLVDFSMVYLDKESDIAQFYLEVDQSGLNTIKYEMEVLQNETGGIFQKYREYSGSLVNTDKYLIINDIEVPEGKAYVKLTVHEELEDLSWGIYRDTQLEITNSATAPEIVLTNSVESMIAYNNVYFSWKGYHDSKYKPDIMYSYNFDDSGWTIPNSEWQKIEFYELEEGYHNFRVKAVYNGEESSESNVTFFVDVNNPVIDDDKIITKELHNENGVLYAVKIKGLSGALTDSSLNALVINNETVEYSDDGSFYISEIPVGSDGINEIKITAFDKVGNYTDLMVQVDNTLTEILFPEKTGRITYAPVTLVGRLNENVNTHVDIYISDPMCGETAEGDYTGWKKARINEDRTFFVEDIFVNPGTTGREAHTPLLMHIVTPDGLKFTRTIDLWANNVILPIDLDISTHAVEGQTEETEIVFSCTAEIDNISSWSMDFDGDGIYDLVDVVDNPKFAQNHTWTHTYSAIGIVKPRVRIITFDGKYFSVSEDIIIHEKIKEASNKMIDSPIAMAMEKMADDSSRIYVLAGSSSNYRIEVYEVGRNETYISNKLYTVSLKGYGIDNPVKIDVIDKDHILIASNRGGFGTVYTLCANEYGNYQPLYSAEFMVDDEIADMDADENNVYVSVKNSNTIAKLPVENLLPVPSGIEYLTPEVKAGTKPGSNLGISKDSFGIIAADYYNKRLIRLSNSVKVLEYFGEAGPGEGEFEIPELIKSYQNRIFVYDKHRKDIQIFDPDYKPVTTLKYDTTPDADNYIETEFFNDLGGLGVVTKIENERLFYYALLLSRTTGKLAMLRLPQWEEMRATVRNNRIIFLKDREVYTAKPNGSDLLKVISSDSIPRIEGTLDYPALSPDGRKVVFTSRIKLYDGESVNGYTEENSYVYDNLYVIDVNGKNLTRIPLGTVDKYEIERPEFNSNGDRIIFSAKPVGGRWQIYIYNFKTGGIEKLFSSDENARFPYYSPDDRFVVFTTDYDGDEEIEIIDTQNTAIRVSVTSNNTRDSFPVWSVTYPYEISDPDLKIESKISFISERGYHKGLYYSYLARPSDSDIRIVKKTGENIEDDPDTAAIEITSQSSEGDYPCFTGDGRAVVYEYFDGSNQSLNRFEFSDTPAAPVSINIPEGAVKPAGMKNTIANFNLSVENGNEALLEWNRYTEQDIFYTVRFKLNAEGEEFVQKKVFSQTGTRLTGLKMGAEYLFRVMIVENGEEAAASQWKELLIPEVAARPSFEIDSDNPYLVRLKAWKPEVETAWKFKWLIDNQEINADSSDVYLYEFATSGTKTIMLKASNRTDTYTTVSEPMTVNIISDIKPAIEYVLADNTSYIELSAENSLGNRIEWSSAAWIISGPGQTPVTVTGSRVIVPLDKFKNKINVNLTLRRITVNGQSSTDILEKNMVIDLDLKDVKPVITYDSEEGNPSSFVFSGADSLGNIDWLNARWKIYANGELIHQETGISTFPFQFPERSAETRYSVSLTLPRINDGISETTSVNIDVEPAEIEPEIDYEILTLETDGVVRGSKVLFSCSNSRGNNIDFSSAKWSVPVAGTYGEQPTQVGPTAIYNLAGIEDKAIVEVSLTLMRKGGTDVTTVTKSVSISTGEIAGNRVVVKTKEEYTAEGRVIIFDALSSTGPNINWESTQWLLDGEYTKTGPVARLEVPETGVSHVVNYACTLYRYGAEPIMLIGEFDINSSKISPVVNYQKVEGGSGNVFQLDVTDTEGINIDWERTAWYIYDGNESVVQKYGAAITHAFAFKDDDTAYHVMVEMFYKGNAKPYTVIKSIDVERDELVPVITWDLPDERSDENIVLFDAKDSLGSNIDWTQSKWTFGDSSESQYGKSAVHKYPADAQTKEYKVSLTIVRKSSNGTVESSTTTKNVRIASDKVVPVVKAKLNPDGYLVLSAEESEGRGILLDRCQWIFEGKGDSESGSVSTQTGKIRTNSYSESATAGVNGGDRCIIVATTTEGANQSVQSYDNYKNTNESFSSSNTHTGAICRKYIDNVLTGDYFMVTLFVYRVDSSGGMTGESVTVNIDLDEARKGRGVRYE